ncbi:hypothetical protein L2U69_11750 [Zavarzinia compransoris]|uniref:hypothetical protein n=1 Tax=Zavarzinia marina TaxID=2911065 RepID=UPI001F389583|nr:hypothetical protein [Zavarzinia marina]MCF4166320.1 hypothetical protein [Zavarzinia marina]
MADLPDTPKWSPLRRAAVIASWCAGAAMVARGLTMVADPSIALEAIRQGTDLMTWTTAIYVGGASVERLGAWRGGRT